jgi:hypothetical protein
MLATHQAGGFHTFLLVCLTGKLSLSLPSGCISCLGLDAEALDFLDPLFLENASLIQLHNTLQDWEKEQPEKRGDEGRFDARQEWPRMRFERREGVGDEKNVTSVPLVGIRGLQACAWVPDHSQRKGQPHFNLMYSSKEMPRNRDREGG